MSLIRIQYWSNGLYELWIGNYSVAIAPFGKLWAFVWRLQSTDFRYWYEDTISFNHYEALHPNGQGVVQ